LGGSFGASGLHGRFILAAGACALAFASVLPSFAADMPRSRHAEPALLLQLERIKAGTAF